MARAFLRSRTAPLALGLLLPVAVVTAAGASGGEPLDPKTFDTATTPCNDFYQFVNGTWMQKNPVPADQPYWGAFDELQERNLAIAHQILEDAAANKGAAAGSIERK
ncbi:MAG TPA: M13 family metallopeptidase N-terminal domain-containing protein, partial [Thermoanaerobaculia bacterium]